ncbi:MAG: class II aldolase [Alphaproteobacteria bacterium]|nr:class II aldolase [Alphaproteobacteria bacterium]
MLRDQALRAEIIATCRQMNALGINQGTAGNVSARTATGFLITPSGVAYERMRPGDLVAMAFDGTATGRLKPSSEWRIHRDILAHRAEAGAVIHTHASHCTALACLRRGIPAFHYMVAVAGGSDIRCARYATFGTQALSDAALTALAARRACLLANHGMVCLGADLAAALALALEVETLATQYWRALQIGRPKLLSEHEMRRVLRCFRRYGQPRRSIS